MKVNKEFYKERILDLTTHLLNGYDIKDPAMEEEFNNYINACVHYFYKVDFNDAFQREHIEKEKLETILEEPVEKHVYAKMMPKKIVLPYTVQKIFNENDEELKHKRLNI